MTTDLDIGPGWVTSEETALVLPQTLQFEALVFQRDMREFGGQLKEPSQVAPEVLAERFCKNAVSVARQQSQYARTHYLEEVRTLVRADFNICDMSDPTHRTFLGRLHTLLSEAISIASHAEIGIQLRERKEP
ncbi:hypothetical protein [Methylobacterium sp. CM6246]